MDLPAHINMQSNGVGTVTFGRDDNLNVLFHKHPVLNPAKSRDAGRPINDVHVYVRIQHPGERDIVHRPATDVDRMRFPRQWQAFERNQAHVPSGTPVEQLFPDRPDLSANLHGAGIHTVEQLANLTGEGINGLGMGAQDYVNRAKKYMSVSEKGAAFHQMQRIIEDLKNQNEVQQRQLMLMNSKLEALLSERAGTATKTLLPVTAQAPIAAQSAPPWSEQPSPSSMAAVDASAWNAGLQQAAEITPMATPLPPLEYSDTETSEFTPPKRRGRPPGARNKPKE